MNLFGLGNDEEDLLPAAASAAPEEDPLAPYKQQVIDQIKQKYSLGDFSPEKRQELVDQTNADTSGSWRPALAAIGAGLQGKDAQAAAQSTLKQQTDARNAKIGEFDKNRNLFVQNQEFADKQKLTAEAEDKKKREMDPTSPESLIAKQVAQKMNPDGNYDNLTAAQFQSFSPALKQLYDIRAKEELAKTSADDRRAMYADRAAERSSLQEERNALKEQQRQDKLSQGSKPSDKQIEAFTDLDNAKNDLSNILGQLGKNSGWTGAIDGRIPDMLVGNDQVAWRSAVGKYKDAYRKAVTGAGASNAEIARLESRLPSETDTYENFLAKANEAQAELDKKKQTLAENLTKGGKDVSKFVSSEAPKYMPDTVQVQAPDGSIRKIPKDKVRQALASGGKLLDSDPTKQTQMAGAGGEW